MIIHLTERDFFNLLNMTELQFNAYKHMILISNIRKHWTTDTLLDTEWVQCKHQLHPFSYHCISLIHRRILSHEDLPVNWRQLCMKI